MDHQQAIQQLLKQGIVPTSEKVEELIITKTRVTPTDKISAPGVEVIESHHFEPCKITPQDFVVYFRNRYSVLKNLLLNRVEASNAISISRAKQVLGNNTIIAMISDVKKLPTGTYRLEVEDLTGKTVAIVSKNSEALKKAPELTHDEVVALQGSFSKNVMFVKDIIWPDIPQIEIPACPEDVYVAFSSDVHVGSRMFLKENFEKFISWLRGELGDETQKEIARKVKYVFFIGDLVDGIGVYPGQEEEITISDLKEQFREVAFFLKQIPKDKQIIVCPGNHDSIRINEPQPKFSKEFAAELHELENVTFVSNPAYLRLHRTGLFPGLNVLIYHGYSFDYYANEIEMLRLQGGYDRPDKIMEYLVKKRHLAPTHRSTLILPMKVDPLIITTVPHVFATGHIHKAKIAKYKSLLLIASSCWQARTTFQEKVGHHPEPCKVPILNLKTRKATMLDFS